MPSCFPSVNIVEVSLPFLCVSLYAAVVSSLGPVDGYAALLYVEIAGRGNTRNHMQHGQPGRSAWALRYVSKMISSSSSSQMCVSTGMHKSGCGRRPAKKVPRALTFRSRRIPFKFKDKMLSGALARPTPPNLVGILLALLFTPVAITPARPLRRGNLRPALQKM